MALTTGDRGGGTFTTGVGGERTRDAKRLPEVKFLFFGHFLGEVRCYQKPPEKMEERQRWNIDGVGEDFSVKSKSSPFCPRN